MQMPLEVSFRGVRKSPSIDNLIRAKVDKLEEICDYLTSCRVAIEKLQEHQRAGRPYRVRIELRVPPGHDLVVRLEPSKGAIHEQLPQLIRRSFAAARRRLEKLVEQQRGEVKSHPRNQSNGVVTKLLRNSGYGFIQSADGREIYFHRNAVTAHDFDRLQIGAGVRYVEESGQEGPQATVVQIRDKVPRSRVV